MHYQRSDIIKSLLLAPIPLLIIFFLIFPPMIGLSIFYLAMFPLLFGICILLNKFQILNGITVLLSTFIISYFLGHYIAVVFYDTMTTRTFITEFLWSWIGLSIFVTAFNFSGLLIWYNYKRSNTNVISTKPD